MGSILVVEDDASIRRLVKMVLERAGYEVEQAADGLEAVLKLGVCDYDAVILDLMMPNLDGYGLIQRLKERGGQHPAIIVISAAHSAALRGLDGSMVHSIIRKPFDIDVLGDLISAAADSMTAQPEEMPKQGDVLRFRREDVC